VSHDCSIYVRANKNQDTTQNCNIDLRFLKDAGLDYCLGIAVGFNQFHPNKLENA
jgi:hypothetical protein